MEPVEPKPDPPPVSSYYLRQEPRPPLTGAALDRDRLRQALHGSLGCFCRNHQALEALGWYPRGFTIAVSRRKGSLRFEPPPPVGPGTRAALATIEACFWERLRTCDGPYQPPEHTVELTVPSFHVDCFPAGEEP